MRRFRVTEAKHENGFARVADVETQVELTADLFVTGDRVRLRAGDSVTELVDGRRLREVRLLKEAPPPAYLVDATRDLVEGLQRHGIVIDATIAEIAAAEWRQDLRISTGPGTATAGHPVLAPLVRGQLTFLIDWDSQGYAEERQEHPFDDATLPARLERIVRRHVSGFRCEASVDGFQVTPPGMHLAFGDWEWCHPHAFFISLASMVNDLLASSGTTLRWIDTEEEDWVFCTFELARLLVENNLLLRL